MSIQVPTVRSQPWDGDIEMDVLAERRVGIALMGSCEEACAGCAAEIWRAEKAKV